MFLNYLNTMFALLFSCIPMTAYDEEQLLMNLSKAIKNSSNNENDVPTDIHLIYRKLIVRKLKRERNLKYFNLDEHIKDCLHRKALHGSCNSYSQINAALDKFNVSLLSSHFRLSFLENIKHGFFMINSLEASIR